MRDKFLCIIWMLLYCADKCWEKWTDRIAPSIRFILRWVPWSKMPKRTWNISCWQVTDIDPVQWVMDWQLKAQAAHLVPTIKETGTSFLKSGFENFCFLEAFKTLFNDCKGDALSLARDNNNKDKLWFLRCELVWGHTVTQGAALLCPTPFRRWQYGERRGSRYSHACTDGWEKDTADIPYSKLNSESSRAKKRVYGVYSLPVRKNSWILILRLKIAECNWTVNRSATR